MTRAPLLGDMEAQDRKRFRFSARPERHLPLIVVDPMGEIHYLTPAVYTLLEYTPQQPLDSCLFTHIHSRNLQQVRHDLEAMQRAGKQRAFWLLRLRTARGHWRWFQVQARNALKDGGGILLHLRPLQQA